VSGFKFSTEVRVRLPETDAFGIAYHGCFFTWFDVARMDYLRNLGLMDVVRAGRANNLIVHVDADFKSPARFDDVLVIEARISEIGSTSFTFRFRVTHKSEGRLVAEGRSVHVVLDDRSWRPVPVPPDFRELVGAFET
jgi:acyl-CoA thioester hydrolase